MRLKFIPALLAAALLGVAAAVPSPTPASVMVNASVSDACEITNAPAIEFDYQAADLTTVTGSSVTVRCNLDTEPFLGYWDDTQWNADGTVDLLGAGEALKVTLDTDFDWTAVVSNPADGSQYTYGITATAATGQWTASSGVHTTTVDYYIGW